MADSNENEALVKQIAQTLGETEEGPVSTIERMVRILGEEKTVALLQESLQIQADGGMKTDDGKKQRTLGGVFFKLTKGKISSRERWLVFKAGKPGAQKQQKKAKPLTWEESREVSLEAVSMQPRGKATKVKVTIVGRPGRVIEKGKVVITSMENSKPPNLPKGLPAPPGDPTVYLVYIAMKQWRKVKESLEDPSDKLIIEGYPVFDKRIGKTGAMTIYAQSTTTKLIQQARREAQRTERS